MLNKTEVKRALRRIEKAEEAAEDLAAWSVLAAERFKPKDRVIFNARAKKRSVARIRKGEMRQGVVTRVSDNFAINVRLDGNKHSSGYHHSFFDLVEEN